MTDDSADRRTDVAGERTAPLTPRRAGAVGLVAGLVAGALATALSPGGALATGLLVLLVLAVVTALVAWALGLRPR